MINYHSNATFFAWCPEAESNHRHGDFQSPALPTELSGQNCGGHKWTRTTDLTLIRRAL